MARMPKQELFHPEELVLHQRYCAELLSCVVCLAYACAWLPGSFWNPRTRNFKEFVAIIPKASPLAQFAQNSQEA